jgi:hypothetical protein
MHLNNYDTRSVAREVERLQNFKVMTLDINRQQVKPEWTTRLIKNARERPRLNMMLSFDCTIKCFCMFSTKAESTDDTSEFLNSVDATSFSWPETTAHTI